MKHLKVFETTADFETVRATLDRPNVSLIEATMGVNYLPYITPSPQHEYVEIAGIKWATMNVGANSITDKGLLFQWGDTQGYTTDQVGNGEGQKYFGIDDYIFEDNGSYTKYTEGDSKITLEPTDDAVTVAWGGNWRMPTVSEFIALNEAVTTVWTDDYQGSGVAGLVCTDNTDSSKVLFFPTCCYALNGFVNIDDSGYYWSSSLNVDYGTGDAYCFDFANNILNFNDYNQRYFGCLIRGILDE